MKPIIKYRGGKSKEIPQILPYIPQFTGRYIEPFFGGGALFFYLEPSNAIINDINENLINFYNDVRNNYYKIKKELSSSSNASNTPSSFNFSLEILNSVVNNFAIVIAPFLFSYIL